MSSTIIVHDNMILNSVENLFSDEHHHNVQVCLFSDRIEVDGLIVFKITDLVGVHVVKANNDLIEMKLIGYPIQQKLGCFCLLSSSRSKRYRKEYRLLAKADMEHDVQNWKLQIIRLMRGITLEEDAIKTRSLLVFINPNSGAGYAKQIWAKYGEQMFRDAGIDCTVVLTSGRYHARDYVRDCLNLCAKFDGIVIVSGDGLVHEVLQGMMTRPDWSNVMKSIPVGVIPAGSGNGLAHTVADAAGEKRGSPLNNAFVIARGITSPLDVCVVDTQEGKRLYSFLSVEFAFIADLDIESERFRFLGGARFTVMALVRLLRYRRNFAKLSYLAPKQVDYGEVASTSLTNADLALTNDNSPSSSSLGDQQHVHLMQPSTSSSSSTSSLFRTPRTIGLKSPMPYWSSHHQEDTTQPSEPRLDLCPPLSESLPTTWNVVQDEFYFMWNTNCKWMSSEGNIAPDSRLDDGFAQLCFLRKNNGKGSKFQLLKFLLGLENGSHIRNEAIEMVPVQAYRIEPLQTHAKSKMAVDGEEISMQALQVEVLRGLGKVFSH